MSKAMTYQEDLASTDVMDCWWGVGMAQSYSWLWAALVWWCLFFPLQVIFNSEAKYLMYTGFLSCMVVGIKKKIQPLFFRSFFSSFKITTLSQCLAAALLVCRCIFQRELAVCPLLHLHCGCLLAGVRKWALLTELRLFGLEVCSAIVTLFRGVIRGGGERTVLLEESLFLFRTQRSHWASQVS